LVALTPRSRDADLVIECAAALRGVLEDAIPPYEQSAGVRVERRYGNSQSALAALAVGSRCRSVPAGR